jgi:hypothetical protein
MSSIAIPRKNEFFHLNDILKADESSSSFACEPEPGPRVKKENSIPA